MSSSTRLRQTVHNPLDSWAGTASDQMRHLEIAKGFMRGIAANNELVTLRVPSLPERRVVTSVGKIRWAPIVSHRVQEKFRSPFIASVPGLWGGSLRRVCHWRSHSSGPAPGVPSLTAHRTGAPNVGFK